MDDREDRFKTIEPVEPALTPLGTPPDAPLRSREGDIIHTAPELAVGEADVRSAEAGEFVRGSSLWRDAWRRLLLCRVRLGHFTIAEETLKRYRGVGGKDQAGFFGARGLEKAAVQQL